MAIVKAENARTDIPLVSIIAVCYNHSKYVEETLDSILNQTYENIELIIIDSNSPDHSVEVIQNWIDRNQVECTFIKQTEPRNVCQNLNEGLRIVTGEFFQGLSCDDVLLPDKIKNQIEVFSRVDQSYALTFSDAKLIDGASKLLNKTHIETHFSGIHIESGNMFLPLLKRCYIPAMSVLIRRSALERVGNYDETLAFEDYDMWLRLARHYKFWFEAEANTLYRIHENNLTKEFKGVWASQYYLIFLKFINIPEVKQEVIQNVKMLYKLKMTNDKAILDFQKRFTDEMLLQFCLRFKLPYKMYRLISIVLSPLKKT
jgi:glycosyltransferase involved in cell wall biosynthesis